MTLWRQVPGYIENAGFPANWVKTVSALGGIELAKLGMSEDTIMNAKSSSERLGQAMAQARRHWQAQRKLEQAAEPAVAVIAPAFTVALSRESGTNGTLIARALGVRLGWPVYDKELIQRIAEEMGLRAELLESMDEKHRSWLTDCLEALSSAPAPSGSGFIRHLVETLLALNAHGACVVVGRGAPQIMPPETTLRVRLVAPLKERIANKARALGLSEEEAKRRVETTDRERKQFVRSHFQKDPADPSFYDLVLNSARFSVRECADLIVEALQRLPTRAVAKEPALAI